MAQRVIFSDEARADLRAIDRETALRLLKALACFLKTDAGSVKLPEGFQPPRYRLRVGDWRYIFRYSGEDTIEVLRVRNRREAYRRVTRQEPTHTRQEPPHRAMVAH